MVDIELPAELDEEFMKLIPYQRMYINKLMKKGSISNYSLSYNRRKLWVVIHAASEFEVKQIIGAFPIFNYMKFKIHGLIFHDSSTITTPQLWLN